MPMTDLFAPLERVVKKYRRDVHRLGPETPSEALVSLESHLGKKLPPALRTFLARHNGAQLFRGALRIRGTNDITFAAEQTRAVVLFADGNEGERWAWAADDDGDAVFGLWKDERLQSMYSSFQGWLAGSIAVLDTKVIRPSEQAELRLEAASTDGVQLLLAGERALEAGRPEQAEGAFRQATRCHPLRVIAWQRLGEALAFAPTTWLTFGRPFPSRSRWAGYSSQLTK